MGLSWLQHRAAIQPHRHGPAPAPEVVKRARERFEKALVEVGLMPDPKEDGTEKEAEKERLQ